MHNTNDLKTRSGIAERIDIHKTDFSQSESDMEVIARDVESIRNTLKKLDFSTATSEGADEINSHIDAAEDITKEEFKKEDDILEKKQDDSAFLEKDLSRRNETSEKNMDKVAATEKIIKTSDTVNELNKARNAAIKDVEFLMMQIDRAKKERERSDTVRKQLQARII